MRRRDFNSGLLLAGTAIQPLLVQAATKQRRIAIVAAAGKPENISEAGSGFWHAFFLELRHLGLFEGGDLIVERYSAEGHPGRYDDLAREVVSLNPDIILVTGNLLARAFRPRTGPTPIVATLGDPLATGMVKSSARPGEYLTGAYGSDNTETARQIANDVHQILGGVKPGDIPIYQATKFEFVINLTTANALGLNLPQSLLALADEVIE